jgi:hypothetical protein
LQGFVYVNDGATLTVDPGTVIRGDKNSKGTLIIRRGAKIHAVGNSAQPIVFTSNQPAGSRDYGDWGGIVLCGRANNNQPGGEAIIEGGPDASYGGGSSPNDADNSGILQFVRIEFPGIALQPNQEINGLSLCAVGNGTIIDHIQVSYSGDDSYEFFGGTVNMMNIVAFRGWDDEFDTDNAIAAKCSSHFHQHPAIADQSGSNGFESDNDASVPPVRHTHADLQQCDILRAVAVAGGTRTDSSTCRAYPPQQPLQHLQHGLRGLSDRHSVDGLLTEADATSNTLQIHGSIVAGCPSALEVVAGSTFDIASWFHTSGSGNSVMANLSDLGVSTPLVMNAPALLPNGGSPLLSGADFSGNASDPFFQQVAFRGAFGTQDWTAGWCNWDPQNTAY